MKRAVTEVQMRAIRGAISAHELVRPGIARRLFIQRIEELSLTDEEWASLVTLIQIFEMHEISLAALRRMVTMLAAAMPGSDE